MYCENIIYTSKQKKKTKQNHGASKDFCVEVLQQNLTNISSYLLLLMFKCTIEGFHDANDDDDDVNVDFVFEEL
jgi:hypothetical protein